MTWQPGGSRKSDRRGNVVGAIVILGALAVFFFCWGLTVGAILWK